MGKPGHLSILAARRMSRAQAEPGYGAVRPLRPASGQSTQAFTFTPQSHSEDKQENPNRSTRDIRNRDIRNRDIRNRHIRNREIRNRDHAKEEVPGHAQTSESAIHL